MVVKYVVLVAGPPATAKKDLVNRMDKSFNFYHYKFLNELIDIARTFDFDGAQTEKGREILRSIDKLARSCHEDIYARKLFRRIEDSLFDRMNRIIVSDLATTSEYEYVKSWCAENGYKLSTIWIDRPMDSPVKPEIRELELTKDSIPFDYIIDMDETFGAFDKRVFRIGKAITGGM